MKSHLINDHLSSEDKSQLLLSTLFSIQTKRITTANREFQLNVTS